MKKAIAITSLLCATAATPHSHALSTEAKQSTSFFASALTGAAAAGPVGFIVGALSGAYIGEQIKKADTMTITEQKLADSQAQIAELQRQLLAANQHVRKMEQLALDSLQFQVLFHTGKDSLTPRGVERLQALANFLNQNPQLHIRLDGHADPRGTDEYNNVLADYRARNVAQQLIEAGVDSSRIERYSHGADQSTAPQGNAEAYAMERRVNIEVYNPQQAPAVSQLH